MNLTVQTSYNGTARYWSFHFKEFSGWAVFTINEDTKEFSIQSDWGEWCHRWPAAGITGKFIDFLASCDPEYVVRKFAQGGKAGFKELDLDATFEEMHRRVCEMRREECISKHQAREVWRDLKQWRHSYWEMFGGAAGNDDGSTITAAYLNVPDSVNALDLLQDEWVHRKPTTAAAFLQNELLPFFFQHLKETEL